MLPIPDRRSPTAYRNIRIGDEGLADQGVDNLGTVMAQLTQRRISPLRRAHLDPDLCAASLPRSSGWQPAFGQRGAALAHLQKQGVAAGDLFLFFGWFKQTELVRGRLQYQADAPDIHAIFGWLQIGQTWSIDEATALPDWLALHPHGHPTFRQQNSSAGNVIFVAASDLVIDQRPMGVPGGGIFPRLTSRLQLTGLQSQRRSQWQLPRWFYPTANRPPLTYHGDLGRWTPQPNHTLLQSVGRGQEFVLDCDAYPESWAWLAQFWNR